MNNNILYVAKQLAKESTQKYIGFTCPSAKERAFKNECFDEICKALKEFDIKTVAVDFDKNKQSIAETVDTERIKADDADLVLINLPCVYGNEHIFVNNDKLKNIVLSVCYGKTTYNYFEKTVDVFNENEISLKAVISKKRHFAVSGVTFKK